MKFTIALIQNNPIIGQIETNVTRIRQLVNQLESKINGKPVDLVVLPELAVTGYNFEDKSHIKPYLETAEQGPAFSLGREISKRFKCFTVIGYPELHHLLIYNSCYLISPTGSLLYNYRKTHLYETDEVWGCNENPDKTFRSIELIVDKDYYLNPEANRKYHTVTTNFGICMDLNPYKFEAPFTRFEMALTCFENKAKLIICPMAWLSPKSPSVIETLTKEQKLAEASKFTRLFDDGVAMKPEIEGFSPTVPDKSTVNYWILRFFPFMRHSNNWLTPNQFKTVVVCNNRVGLEKDVMYGGSSTIFQFDGTTEGNEHIDDQNSSVTVFGSLGMGTEGVLVHEVDLDID